MMKKSLCYISILSLMLLLCACGNSSEAKGVVTVCVDGNGLNETFLEPILEEFKSQNPEVELVVEYLPVPANSHDGNLGEERSLALTETRTEVMNGEGADVYLFFNSPSPKDYETYMLFPNLEQQIRENVFHDLDFLFKHTDFNEDDYIPSLKQAGEYNGKSYVLPISYTVPTMIALAEPLENSAFDEDIANNSTKEYMEQMLSLSEAQRPYLSTASRSLLMKTPSISPVSIGEAKLQLNEMVWKETMQLNRNIIETCGYSDEDFIASLDYETCIQEGAVFLPGLSSMSGYYLRLLEDEGYKARLFPIPNEKGNLSIMPDITAVVSAKCENTDAVANLLLFLLSDTVQGSEKLEQSGENATLFINANSWPVRKGCAVKRLEQLDLTLVEPGTVSEELKADLEKMEEQAKDCRLAGSYDATLYGLTKAYLDGEQTWEECYSNIEKEWGFLDK